MKPYKFIAIYFGFSNQINNCIRLNKQRKLFENSGDKNSLNFAPIRTIYYTGQMTHRGGIKVNKEVKYVQYRKKSPFIKSFFCVPKLEVCRYANFINI